MIVTFEEFRKIPRLNRDIVVTEKIDGTNAQLLFVAPEEIAAQTGGEYHAYQNAVARLEQCYVFAGSRTRWVQPAKDNFGWAAWVKQHAQVLFDTLGYGRHFGEWWGPGIQRGYGVATKRFSLFHPKWAAVLSGRALGGLPLPPDIGVVPVLFEGPFSDNAIRSCIAELRVNGSSASPGFMRPEGVVVFHTAASQYFKVTLEGDEKPKSIKEGGVPE